MNNNTLTHNRLSELLHEARHGRIREVSLFEILELEMLQQLEEQLEQNPNLEIGEKEILSIESWRAKLELGEKASQ